MGQEDYCLCLFCLSFPPLCLQKVLLSAHNPWLSQSQMHPVEHILYAALVQSEMVFFFLWIPTWLDTHENRKYFKLCFYASLIFFTNTSSPIEWTHGPLPRHHFLLEVMFVFCWTVIFTYVYIVVCNTMLYFDTTRGENCPGKKQPLKSCMLSFLFISWSTVVWSSIQEKYWSWKFTSIDILNAELSILLSFVLREGCSVRA